MDESQSIVNKSESIPLEIQPNSPSKEDILHVSTEFNPKHVFLDSKSIKEYLSSQQSIWSKCFRLVNVKRYIYLQFRRLCPATIAFKLTEEG